MWQRRELKRSIGRRSTFYVFGLTDSANAMKDGVFLQSLPKSLELYHFLTPWLTLPELYELVLWRLPVQSVGLLHRFQWRSSGGHVQKKTARLFSHNYLCEKRVGIFHK
jgi:hypothetical protein